MELILRAIVYRLMCKLGKHNMNILPTLRSINEGTHDRFEVCCVRCGKPTSDIIVKLLIRIINNLES